MLRFWRLGYVRTELACLGRLGNPIRMDLPDRPTWAVIKHLVAGGGLSPTGKQVVAELLDGLAGILGEEFPERIFDKFGGLPGHLLLLGSHRIALPQFLSFALALRVAARDPTFRPVLNGAVAGMDVPAWYHLLLQLEAGRACREMGYQVTYEPAIVGSASKADLMVEGGDEPWLVETTVVLRADADKSWERYEDTFMDRIRAIEHRNRVTCVIVLNDHPADKPANGGLGSITEAWLTEIDSAAKTARAAMAPQVVPAEHGSVTIHPDGVPTGTATFTGALQERDGWKRLRRALAGKAKQIDGTIPVWVRIDCQDGLLAFGQWPKMPYAERIASMADAIHNEIQWPRCARGVVLSSGPALSMGATETNVETLTTETDNGIIMRRLTAPHLVRETVIIPVTPAGWSVARQWRDAYGTEARWVQSDLAAAGYPHMNELQLE
ncbi:MAG TPA: hypothetical protein DGG94_13075 [Micromonosporaceae bacterium]|nr:hypothetical protein [Micromonosporaceae bacterium]HCU50713.1 hypothetical protein [Micromonosporaceae bacterium]